MPRIFDKSKIELNKNIIANQVFAFNIWDIASAKAVIDACHPRPAFLQTSSKVFAQLGKEEFIYFVRRCAQSRNTDVIIHLDHCRDKKAIQEAVDYGWDSIMFDGSHLPLNDNIELTNEVSAICKAKGILVEAEVGQIRGVEDDIHVIGDNVADIRDVETFIARTTVDMLAVAIGTAHGQYGNRKPNIVYEKIVEVKRLTDIPMVIHGGSELPGDVLRRLFSYPNVKKINISTDVKQAYRRGILCALERGLMNESGFDAIKVNNMIYQSIKETVAGKWSILENESGRNINK